MMKVYFNEKSPKSHPATKEIPERYGIFFVSSRHVECVVLMESVGCFA